MKNFLRMLRLYYPALGWVVLGCLLSAVALAANIGLLAISGWFLASMGIAGALGVTMNYFTPAAIIRGLAILRTGGRYAERLVTHDAALRVTATLRKAVFDRLYRMPVLSLPTHSTDALSVLRGDIEAVEKFYLTGFVPICAAAVCFIALGAGLWSIAHALSIAILALLSVAGIISPLLLYPSTRSIQDEVTDILPQLRRSYADYVQGMDEWLVYGVQDTLADGIGGQQARLASAQKALTNNDALMVLAFMLASLSAIAIALFIAVPLAQDKGFPPAYLAMLPLLCMVAFDIVLPVPPALQALASLGNSLPCVFGMLDQAPETGTQVIPGQFFDLSLQNVTFGYGPDVPVLNDFSMALSAGESLAVLGPNGAGKTTLASMIAGLVRPLSGEVVLNGVHMADADLDSWRACFSVAEQRPVLFPGTIRDNLLRASPGANAQDIRDACTLAGLEVDIGRMWHGLDTSLGAEGSSLSGGQMRRLSIARAWLKPASCLILDEPTEGLDTIMAMDLVKRVLFAAKQRGMAVITIMHDRDIAALFDKAIVLSAESP